MKILSKKDEAIILDSIREIKDFPKPGIVFKDITTLMSDPNAFSTLMSHLEARYSEYDLDYIAGLDARGFIFGSILADRLGLGFIPVRKKGKLPYTTISEKYDLEYGSDEIEIHIDAFEKDSRILVIDDLIATGGTAGAAINLIRKANGVCVEACFIMELEDMNGKDKLNATVYSVIKS